ncbi:DUF7010 family protein [Paenibacillus crassostreae]|uniref:Uncharacterized protein n=1 Tax=Paenibacillus crassostreae TaxID=1763538 RepID=A0A167G1W3_9BACL|nr:hypothetical protein [Paenibacillus crassostreae]AOZ93841.1 hypothetical protein LPB68_17745 [Paenibacillus crassostreae]OAB77125.1 hypothetical protein PNBC_06990 [Paenibacillus crassostreae]
MSRTLEELQKEIIFEARKGFPILLSGVIVFLIFTLMPLVFPIEAVRLIWIFGLGAIFPIGILISKILGVNLLTTGNPVGTLGGIVAAPQAFYIPVFIIVYMNIPEYLPFTIGLLAGSHFLPYMWIYKSKAYLFVTLGTCISSLILGGFLVDQAFTLVPLAISIVYGIGVLLILRELKASHV